MIGNCRCADQRDAVAVRCDIDDGGGLLSVAQLADCRLGHRCPLEESVLTAFGVEHGRNGVVFHHDGAHRGVRSHGVLLVGADDLVRLSTFDHGEVIQHPFHESIDDVENLGG